MPVLGQIEKAFYVWKEPRFAAPVPKNTAGKLQIRSDAYGKGFFGASRNGGRKHDGLDFILKVGDPIYAAKSGRVGFSGEGEGYGYYVDLYHPDGLQTRYAHLSEVLVPEGRWVSQGALIGRGGKTGNAKNPHIIAHLHFEIRRENQPLNPSEGLLDASLGV